MNSQHRESKQNSDDTNHEISSQQSTRNVDDELFRAALYKKPEIIFELKKLGLLDKSKGEKTLAQAAEYDSVDVVKALIECGFSPSCSIQSNTYINEVQYTPLGIASAHGSERVVEFLLSLNVKVDEYTHVTRFQSDCTPLREAIIHSGGKKPNPKIVSLLLRHGAKVSNINSSGINFLAHYGDADELELLLNAGLNPNILVEGEPLLSKCIGHNTYKLAMILIKKGADVHYVDGVGRTYLHRSHNAELTQLLIDKGLNVSALDKLGYTPVKSCTDKESIELMVKAGASVRKLSIHNHLVLSSPFLAKKVIEETKPDFSTVDEDGKTVLRKLASSASLSGYLETLKYILENIKTVDINQAGQGGWTALHDAFAENQGFMNMGDAKVEDKYVAESKYTQAIDLLIAHGAKPLKDKSGRTPLMCLTFNGFSVTYTDRVIARYYKAEANYYTVAPEFYKQELDNLRHYGFQAISTPGALGFFGCTTSVPRRSAIDQFWDNIEQYKNTKVLSA